MIRAHTSITFFFFGSLRLFLFFRCFSLLGMFGSISHKSVSSGNGSLPFVHKHFEYLVNECPMIFWKGAFEIMWQTVCSAAAASSSFSSSCSLITDFSWSQKNIWVLIKCKWGLLSESWWKCPRAAFLSRTSSRLCLEYLRWSKPLVFNIKIKWNSQ